MSEKLLPCPLCGPGQVSLNPPSETYRYGSINCPGCMLTLPGEIKDQREMIEVWNTRPDHAPEPTPDALEAANRRAEHYKHKKEIVATSRNRIAEGMEYWRERALLAESKMASPSTASSDEPVARAAAIEECATYIDEVASFYPADGGSKSLLVTMAKEVRSLVTVPAKTAASDPITNEEMATGVAIHIDGKAMKASDFYISPEPPPSAANTAEPVARKLTKEQITDALAAKLRAVNFPAYGEHKGDWRGLYDNEVTDAINGLLAAPTASPEPDAWQDISTAPKDRDDVWVWNGEQAVMKWMAEPECQMWIYSDDILNSCDPEPEQPTHWRPMPAPPVPRNDRWTPSPEPRDEWDESFDAMTDAINEGRP